MDRIIGKTIVSAILVALVFSASGNGQGTAPEKRVMNFLAVMDLRCGKGIEKDVCSALTEVVIDELVKIGKYTLIDRANRDKILGEAGFQQTGCVDEGCSIEAGRILGVGKMVTGSVTKIGSSYLINLQLLNVETAAVETSASEECVCELNGLIKAVRNASRILMDMQSRPTPSSSQHTEAMVNVPEGAFSMGSDNGAPDEKPVHKIFLNAFLIDKFEVTNEQYRKCVSAGKCAPNKNYEGSNDPQQPVVGVSWNQAAAFCSWAGKRLPTEAEWEKAARGTSGLKYPWGENADCSLANYSDCKIAKPRAVGSYKDGASPYGAMDMAGNVWEWCADRYDAAYYANSPERNPTGPKTGDNRVMRGGSYFDEAGFMRTSNRSAKPSDHRARNFGFRCAKTP